MGDNWVIDWLEQRGEEKGLERGRIEEARRAILRVIERRFGGTPSDLRARVEALETLPRLEWLHEEAVTCASLAELEALLDKA